MNQFSNARRVGHPLDIPPRWLWIRWPVVFCGGGGAAVAYWQGEVILLGCLPLAMLPLLAGPLFLFNHMVFHSTKLPREGFSITDPDQTIPKGDRS